MEIISPKTDFLAKELFMKKYHSVYYLRDEEGKLFTDLFEVHIIELRKQLKGNDAVNDWIRFFNAKSGEELDMIHTKNVGINAAIGEVKKMSLSEHMRARYEAHMKEIRDRNAREDYVRKLGREEGENRANELYRRLAEQNRMEDIVRATADAVYREELYQEFGM